MSTQIQLPPRPQVVPGEEPHELRMIEQYGRHYKIRRWCERTAGEQSKIECALSAFRTFRAERGEALVGDIWTLEPPAAETVKIYMGYLRRSSKPWRDSSVAALRLYFLHIENPELFRMVEARRVRA